MPFETPTVPTAQAAALAMVGRFHISNADFLTGFLQRLGVSTDRPDFLTTHPDQVGAWSEHLRAHRLCHQREQRRVHAGDLFLQRMGPRADWKALIVTDICAPYRFAPGYPLMTTPTRYIELVRGRVTERVGDLPIQGTSHPEMFRFRRADEVMA